MQSRRIMRRGVRRPIGTMQERFGNASLASLASKEVRRLAREARSRRYGMSESVDGRREEGA